MAALSKHGQRRRRTDLCMGALGEIRLPGSAPTTVGDSAQDRLRAEAAALAADDTDRAESAQVLRDVETLRAW